MVQMAEVIVLEGNGTRPSHRGVWYSEDGKMFTLNTIERHIVCFAPEQNNCTSYKESDISATLCTKYHYGTGGDALLVCECEEQA